MADTGGEYKVKKELDTTGEDSKPLGGDMSTALR